MSSHSQIVDTVEQATGYRFSDSSLLRQAMTHPSLNVAANNQRLEFLGDAILSAAVADLLFALYPQEPEGDLARRLASLVRGQLLAEQALVLGLDKILQLSSGEDAAGGRSNPTNLEDAMEALVGAIYLDGGYEAVQSLITRHWKKLAVAAKTPPKDDKTSLQEWVQARGKPLPSYTTVETTGPAHAPVFTVEVRIEGLEPVRATASTKRTAEQKAARQILANLS